MSGSPKELVLNREEVLRLLARLGNRLAAKGIHAEVFIVGGAAMALAYDADRTTSDIDAILRPRDLVYNEANSMAEELGIPDDWLNDSVRSLMPSNPDDAPKAIAEFPGITITTGSPEFMLAMKSMVTRKSVADLQDAAKICVMLGIYDEYYLERTIRKYIGTGALGSQELWLEDIVELARKLAPDS